MRLEESSNALAREVAEQRDRLEIIRCPTCVYIIIVIVFVSVT